MATLTSTKIKNTYDALLKSIDNDAIGSTAKQITDGLGNGTPLYISTTQIGIGVTPEATYDLHVYSNAKVGGNLTVTGDLTVEGTTTTIDTQTLTVEDPLIEVASNNTSTDAVDIGWYGKYAPSGTVLYAGLFRDTGDSKFKLFRNLEEQPTTTVNTSGTGYTRAGLVIGGLEATTGDFTDTVTVDGDIEVENASGFGRIEIGGSSGAYIDLKSPFSDDFDLRLYTAGTNAQINALNGELDITANTNINLQYQGTDVLVMSSTGVAVTGTGSFTGQVTIPETPVADTDAASKGYVDSQVTAQDLDFAGDSGTGSVDLDSQSLSITGGTLITTTALNQNLDIDHDSVSRTDTTSSASPSFGGTFTAVDSVTSSTEGHITAINLKTVTVPTPTYPAVNNNTITINAGSNLDTGGAFTLNQSFDEIITIDLATTITGLTSVSSTTFSGQLDGTISSTTTATTQTQGDNSTKVATTAYVDSAIGGQDTLAEVLVNGNTTGGTDISVSANDDITFADNSKSIYGAGSDLSIYSDGTDGYVIANVDDLVLRSADDIFIEVNSGANAVKAVGGAAVELYYNNSKKFETTSSGISVTGDGDALSVNRGSFNVVTNLTSVNHNIISTGKAFNIKTSDSNNLTFLTNNTTALTLDTSQNATFAGNVGIGTTSPLALLNVNTGASGTTDAIIISRDTYGEAGVIKQAAGGIEIHSQKNLTLGADEDSSYTGSSSNVIFKTDGSERMRIDSSGDVGIGTTSLTNSSGYNTLSISGTTGAQISFQTSGVGKHYIYSTATDFDIYNGQAGNLKLYTNSTERMRITSGGELQLGTGAYTSIQFDPDPASHSGNGGLDIEPLTSPGSGTANWYTRFKSRVGGGTTNHNVTIDGSVGIGTDSPSNKLEVDGNIAVKTTSGNSGIKIITNNTSEAFLIMGDPDDNSMGGLAYNNSTNTLSIDCNNAERMTIDSSGNVGIGDEDPDYKLDINETGTSTYVIHAQKSGTSLGGLYVDANSNAELFLKASGNSTQVFLNTDGDSYFNGGNVGIGTTSPTSKLHSVITTAGDSALKLQDDTGSVFDFQCGISGVTGDALLIKDTTLGYDYLTLRSGRVGIKTTSPNVDLEVSDNSSPTIAIANSDTSIAATQTIGMLEFASNNETSLSGAYTVFSSIRSDSESSVTGTGTVNGLLSFYTAFANSLTERMRISSLGRVEIGTRSYVGSATSTTRLYLEGTNAGHNLGQFQMADQSGGFMFYLSGSSPTSRQSHQFYNNRIDSSPTLVGSIQINSSSTAFNTSSDYRLKENVVEMTGALDRVEQLKPSRFNFIGHEEIVDGFLAHEVSDIVPEAITGEKDATYQHLVSEAVEAQDAVEWIDKPTLDNTKVEIQEWLDDNNIEWQSADTKQELLDRIPEYQQEAVEAQDAVYETRPEYQGIDQSKLVPLLVGAIKELKAEIETLKAQIN